MKDFHDKRKNTLPTVFFPFSAPTNTRSTLQFINLFQQTHFDKMAREKRIAHKSPNSLSDTNRDITSAQAKLVRNQNTHEHRQALVNSSVPEETPVSVGFVSRRVLESPSIDY